MASASWLFDEMPHVGRDERSWRHGLLMVLLLFAMTRLVTWTGAYSGAYIRMRMTQDIDPPWEGRGNAVVREQLGDPNTAAGQWVDTYLRHLAPLMHWDSEHYRDIALNGYRYRPDGHAHNIAFFPAYPLLCRPFIPPGDDARRANAAMVAVSHACALAAVLLIYGWMRRRVGHRAALTIAAAVLCWPTACYYAFGYSEALALLLIALTCYLVDRGWFWAAAVACGLATATRPTVAVVAPVVLLAWWLAGSVRDWRRLWQVVPLGVLSVGGAGAYAGFLWYSYGSVGVYFENFKAGWIPDEARADWLEFLVAAPLWSEFKYLGRAVRDFPLGLVNLTNPLAWNVPLCLLLVGVSIGGMGRTPPRFRALLLLAPALLVFAYISAGGASFGMTPLSRYVGLAVPALIVLGVWMAREWPAALRHGVLAFLLALQFAWAFAFAEHEWPG